MEQLQVTPAAEESILVRAELSRTLLSGEIQKHQICEECTGPCIAPAPLSLLHWWQSRALGHHVPGCPGWEVSPRSRSPEQSRLLKQNVRKVTGKGFLPPLSGGNSLPFQYQQLAARQAGKESQHTRPGEQHTLPGFGAEMGEGRNPRCVQLGKEKSYRQ